jgi:hypothetical protein
MNYIKILTMSLLLMLSFNSIASDTSNQVNKTENETISKDAEKNESIKDFFEAQIILNNIDLMTKDGFITVKNAEEAKNKYVFQNDKLKERMENNVENSYKAESYHDTEASWTEYITFLNIVKFIAVIILIIAFNGFILQFASFFLVIIVSIPVILYQSLFLILGIVMTFFPEKIWESQAFYLAFFGSFVNIIILGWIAATYDKLFKKLIKLFTIGINPHVLLCIYGAIYFGALAIMYSSSAFGLLAIGFVVSSTGFVIYHSSLCVALGVDKEEHLATVIFSNLIMLFAYSAIKINGIDVPYLEHFTIGIEYLCSLALGICLLIAASPFINLNGKVKGTFAVSTILMFACSILALMGSVFYGLTTIAAFLNTMFILYLFEWIGYVSKQVGWVAFLFALGAGLFGLAMLLEKYPAYFINSLL